MGDLAAKLKELGLEASVKRTGSRYPRKKGDGKIKITVTGHFRPGDGFAFQFYPTNTIHQSCGIEKTLASGASGLVIMGDVPGVPEKRKPKRPMVGHTAKVFNKKFLPKEKNKP